MPCTQYQLLMRTPLQTTASTHVWLLKEERVTRSFEVRVETRRQILRTGYTVFLWIRDGWKECNCTYGLSNRGDEWNRPSIRSLGKEYSFFCVTCSLTSDPQKAVLCLLAQSIYYLSRFSKYIL